MEPACFCSTTVPHIAPVAVKAAGVSGQPGRREPSKLVTRVVAREGGTHTVLLAVGQWGGRRGRLVHMMAAPGGFTRPVRSD